MLRMVFGRLIVLQECSINQECNVAGSGRELSVLFVCSRIAWIVGVGDRDADNSRVLQPLLGYLPFHKP